MSAAYSIRTLKNLSPMAYFILALFATGEIRSIYELKRETGLSLGGIRPVLERLESAGYLSRAEAGGERQRKEIRITRDGRTALARWTWGLDHALTSDLDSILRMAWVAFVNDRQLACRFLHEAHILRTRLAAERRAELSQEKLESGNKASVYCWMKKLAEVETLEAESRALSTIWKELPAG